MKRRVTSYVAVCEATVLDNEANARLIAAAPDLLEVAKLVMPLLEDWHEDDGRACPVWRKTKTATQKAGSAS